MAKQPPDVPADALKRYDAMIETQEGMQRKGAKSAYTSINGHMSSFMTPEGRLALRLPKDTREAYYEKLGDDGIVISYGAVMREYVLIPDKEFKSPKKLAALFAESCEFVRSKKPNPTTKGKKKAKKKSSKKVAKKKAVRKKSTKKK